jgi:CspA family cold shock protein
MQVGSVKWFNAVRGFGFIKREDGRDVFVHYSSIVVDGYRTLTEGELVEYEMVERQQGLLATRVLRHVDAAGTSARAPRARCEHRFGGTAGGPPA